MRFIHLSDLHLGKRMYQFSLLEDQKYILDRIVEIAAGQKADGVLIAGDIYDRVYPSAQAVALFDSFLVRLAENGHRVFVISGNHDSAERIAFLGRLTAPAGVYLSPIYDGNIMKVTLVDEYGPVHIHLLPFIRPVQVRHFHPEEEIEDYTGAIKAALGQKPPDSRERNILVAHQFVTGAGRSDSEEVSVGGLDHVDIEAFEGFDYVALGHLHRPQHTARKEIRYAGSPLAYSASESEDIKSVTVLELKEKGNMEMKEIPLKPLRAVVRLRGFFHELMEGQAGRENSCQDYVHITLLDEEDIPDAFSRLSLVWPNLLHLEYDNTRTRQRRELTVRKEAARLAPDRLFASFYEEMNNQPLNEDQLQYLEKKIAAVWKGESL